ncbi:hypothetical protein FDX19_15580 [Citrobacter sp. wls619]|uniref:hypothetical protein n=1 Tax=Citrobacter sp. wls619 TaxID=2576432 RepID=UPI0010C9E384|nr:hypothetical protein [Citrobacter sp. wls619]TKV08257.1 hypothetical protein FDX19_15580 [Citrobacter sp. wls619]
MTAVTDLQQQRENENLQINMDAIHGQSVTPNQGSNVPYVIQTQQLIEQAQAAYNGIPKVSPPSEEEISHQMWMASGLMGLVTALVTGNAAAGIAGGMSAALAVHDHGYDLRQRGDYIMELHEKGFSAPAILNWYQTGDNKELDKEADRMQKALDRQVDTEERQADREQREGFHKDQMEQGRLAREQSAVFHNDQMRHEGVMENIALQNAGSARISALAKQGAQAGEQLAAGGQPTLQNASFNPAQVQVPQEITDPQERAAYIAAAGRAYHGAILKGAIQQIASAKNLRTSESAQTAMFDKVLEAAQKVAAAPYNSGGDTQRAMQFQVGESPNLSPRVTQNHAVQREMSTGMVDKAYGAVKSFLGEGMTDADRQQMIDLTKKNATAQAESHMQHVQDTVQSKGYDLDNPEVMGALVAAFHVSPDTIRALNDGTITTTQAAQQYVNRVAPEVRKFGENAGQPKQSSGDY